MRRTLTPTLPHRGQVAYGSPIQTGAEMAGRQVNHSLLQRPSLGSPLAHSTIEHRHPAVAEHPEHPPDPRGTQVGPGAIVDNQVISLFQAERAHPGGELIGLRQHMGQRGARVAHLVEIQKYRTRYMSLGILAQTRTATPWQIPGAVHHPYPRRCKTSRQPVGGNDRWQLVTSDRVDGFRDTSYAATASSRTSSARARPRRVYWSKNASACSRSEGWR